MALHIQGLLAASLALAQQILVRQQGLDQIGGHGVAGLVVHGRLVAQARRLQLRIAEARVLEQLQRRLGAGDRPLIHAINNRAALGRQLHIAGARPHRSAFPAFRRNKHQIARGLGQGDAACALDRQTALAQHIAVNRGAHRAGARVQFDTLADDARSQHRGVFNAVKRGDGDVAGAGDQAVCVGRRNHLANLQAAVAGQWVVIAVLQVVDHHIAGGADIELADRVLDGDGHIAVGPNVGQRAADHHIAAHIQRVGR